MDKVILARHPQAHKLPRKVKDDVIHAVRRSLDTNPAAVERAISLLYLRQTASEKATRTTHVDNALGVKHQHGSRIVYYGKWIADGKHLTGHHLDFARKIAHNYAATQLFELAAIKKGLVTP